MVIVYKQPTHGPWSADAPAKIDTLALHLGLEVELGDFGLAVGLIAWANGMVSGYNPLRHRV